MANWSEILEEVVEGGGKQDIIRRKYLKKLNRLTGRNVIAYYSGFLQKPGAPEIAINDNDKNGFMNAVYNLDYSKGLDLILHTPGGNTAATESIGEYLRTKFGKDIRVIVPQLAMSGGTMLACLAKEIVMGKQSSLGPIDPQFMGPAGQISATGVKEEFERALRQITPATAPIWQQVVAKYPPGFIHECEKAITWSETMVRDWLSSGMFDGDPNGAVKIDRIIQGLSNALTLSHARHLSTKKCQSMGFGTKIISLEADQKLQDAVLSVHHTFMLTFDQTPAVKIIENHNEGAFVQTLQSLIIKK
jgi:hypothetical protein